MIIDHFKTTVYVNNLLKKKNLVDQDEQIFCKNFLFVDFITKKL